MWTTVEFVDMCSIFYERRQTFHISTQFNEFQFDERAEKKHIHESLIRLHAYRTGLQIGNVEILYSI